MKLIEDNFLEKRIRTHKPHIKAINSVIRRINDVQIGYQILTNPEVKRVKREYPSQFHEWLIHQPPGKKYGG